MAIDHAIVVGEPIRRIAASFQITEQSIRRHRSHITEQIESARSGSIVPLHANPVRQVARAQSLAERLDQAHAVLDEAEGIARGDKPDAHALVKSVSARAKLIALEFGERRTTITVDARAEWAALPPAEKAERLLEMKHRLLELEAEARATDSGDPRQPRQ